MLVRLHLRVRWRLVPVAAAGELQRKNGAATSGRNVGECEYANKRNNGLLIDPVNSIQIIFFDRAPRAPHRTPARESEVSSIYCLVRLLC